MFSRRIRNKPLAQLCHRLATATGAGIQDQKIWKSEAERGSRAQQHKIAGLCNAMNQGAPISDAMASTGSYFPPLFRQMVEVGDTTGQLDKTYARLAEHYDRALAIRRALVSQLAWPLLQLGMAALVVGVLIFVMGMLPSGSATDGGQIDMLGFGLIGTRGLVIYVNILVVFGIALLLMMEAARRGALWTRSLQRLAVKIPIVGSAIKTLALSRITWAMTLLLDTPLDIRRALLRSMEASGNDHFSRHGPDIVRSIEQGQTIHAALSATGIFPVDLLDHIAVGEQSGRLVETMRGQSVEYERRSAAAMSILAQTAGYIVWAMIATIIILLIFRLFSSYVQQINNLL